MQLIVDRLEKLPIWEAHTMTLKFEMLDKDCHNASPKHASRYGCGKTRTSLRQTLLLSEVGRCPMRPQPACSEAFAKSEWRHTKLLPRLIKRKSWPLAVNQPCVGAQLCRRAKSFNAVNLGGDNGRKNSPQTRHARDKCCVSIGNIGRRDASFLGLIPKWDGKHARRL